MMIKHPPLPVLLLLAACTCDPEPIPARVRVLHAEDCAPERTEALERAIEDWAPAQQIDLLSCDVVPHDPIVNVLDRETIFEQRREDYLAIVVYDEIELANGFYYRDHDGPCLHVMGVDAESYQNRRILSHEFGHMFGLPHTEDPTSVMRDAIPGPNAYPDLATPLECDR